MKIPTAHDSPETCSVIQISFLKALNVNRLEMMYIMISFFKKAFHSMCYQAIADYAPQLVTVVCSRSHIADVDITVVLEHAGMDAPGVQFHQIIPGANIGDTAEVEEVLVFLTYFRSISLSNISSIFILSSCHRTHHS